MRVRFFFCAKFLPNPTFVLFLPLLQRIARGQRSAWIATWAASETADPDPDDALPNLKDQTLRERVRVTLGGRQIRIRLSNECSTAPVLVGGVSVGTPQSLAGVLPASLRQVTFSNKNKILITPGAPALSDPVDIPVMAGSEITISLYFPERVTSVTRHSLALRRAVISMQGDHTEHCPSRGSGFDSSVFLSEVLVPAQAKAHVIVAFGDSIVDGDKSTQETDNNWTSDPFSSLSIDPS